MLTDFKQINFAIIQKKSALVCDCDHAHIQLAKEEFEQKLQQQPTSFEQISGWLETILVRNRVHQSKAVGQFLLNWSYILSEIMQRMTLERCTSFGSFYLVRLFCDDCLIYLLDRRICKTEEHLQFASAVRTILFTRRHVE